MVAFSFELPVLFVVSQKKLGHFLPLNVEIVARALELSRKREYSTQPYQRDFSPSIRSDSAFPWKRNSIKILP
jgi:hypothetical protein